MKIAIATDQGYVSAHFGRCPSYTILEIKEGEILDKMEIPNPGHQPGFLPEFLSGKGVHCIIAGGMGPRAQGLFAQKNIETITGIQGSVDDVIAKFLNQKLKAGEDLCGHKHSEIACNHEHTEKELHHAAGNRICITAKGKDLEAEVDPAFGRALYFLVIDPETFYFEALDNPNIEAAHGAGIQSAQFITNKSIGTVITGDCGPNTQRILQSAGINVITGASGKVKDILLNLKTER